MTYKTPLDSKKLYRACDTSLFSFATTNEIEELDGMLGQARALDALNFGVGIRQHGYNFYVLGPNGSGKHTFVEKFLRQQATDSPAPLDCCYVNNFQQAHKPKVLQFPKGLAVKFHYDMQQLIDDLRHAIPSAFETEEYHAHLNELEDEFKARMEQAFSELHAKAQQHNIALLRTPHGFTFAPMRDGNVLNPKEFRALSEKEQLKYDEVTAVLEEQLTSIIRQQNQWQRELREKIKDLNREVALYASGHFIDELKNNYAEFPKVIEHLDAIQEDVIQHLSDFRGEEETPNILGLSEPRSFRRYEVNVLVDHSETEGAPVVYEDAPLYQNLVGRIEHKAQMGMLTTDFTLIKPGALHRANGGYLLLDAHKVLTQPYAWEGLKRALRSRELRIEPMERMLSLVSTVSLEPEPIPLDIKVIILGDRLIYYLLCEYDPEFADLFKVAADFEETLERTPDSEQRYAQLIATLARKHRLHPFSRRAVARVIEHCSRISGDTRKLSTHMRTVADLLQESHYHAQSTQAMLVDAEHVQHAIDAQARRAGRIKEDIQEAIARGTLLIATAGEASGQINGLSVIELGGYTFGVPHRITARVRLGEGDVIDIEREVDLGGPLHSKGVLILAGFIGAHYAPDLPLSLTASLVFEQSYGQVEGDSASSAELCALLSAVAGAPIKQSLAVTGSVNQYGEIQAIGGVNEKIEGFFDVCVARGLSGEQGVLIPASNVPQLMLRSDVVEAAAQGRFHIYSVATVDQAMSLLTGLPAGQADEDGDYPPDTLNGKVQSRLRELAHLRQSYSEHGKDREGL